VRLDLPEILDRTDSLEARELRDVKETLATLDLVHQDPQVHPANQDLAEVAAALSVL